MDEVVWGFGDRWGTYLQCQGQADISMFGGSEGKKSPASLGQLPWGLEMELKSTFPCPSGEDERNFPLSTLRMTCKSSCHSFMPQFPHEG